MCLVGNVGAKFYPNTKEGASQKTQLNLRTALLKE